MANQKSWDIQGVPLGGAEDVANSLAARIVAIQAGAPAAGDISGIKAQTDKIDAAATNGLAGTSNSLAYRVHEIEKHFHNREYWYGKDPGDAFFLEDGMVPWHPVAGAIGVFGNWTQLSNGDEVTAGPFYDPHKILVITTSVASKLYYLQLGTGAGGAQTVLTTTALYPAASLRQAPAEIKCARVAKTALLWARIACETAAATLDFVIGLHVYAG